MEIANMFRYFKPMLACGLAALFVAAAPVAGSSTPQTQAAEQTDDSAITEQVKAAFAADSSLEGAQIIVQTTQGEVYLSGSVGDSADIQRAADLAMGVPGVKSVKNSLKSQ
jgi:hyperosmotically inducible periplasmic protein